jgi:hypothetical protein
MNATDKQVNAIITIAQRNSEAGKKYLDMGYKGLSELTKEEASRIISRLINYETAQSIATVFFNGEHRTRVELVKTIIQALNKKA